MSSRRATPFIRHAEDWRAVALFGAYRCLVAFGLVTTALLSTDAPAFETAMPTLFGLGCLIYLAECVLAMVAALIRLPALRVQIVVAVAVDVVFFTGLTYASAGVAGGFGMLLIAPLSAAGMLLPGRLAGLLTAGAVIAILGQEALRSLRLPGTQAESMQAGILGALLFFTVLVSHWLARRIRSSEALAAERATEIRDLAELNRRIIRQMQMGAIVVDAQRRIQLINDAALELLTLASPVPQDQTLTSITPELDQALTRWQQQPRETVEVVHAGGHVLLPTFSRLDRAHASSILIFIEDALRQSEQAQQLKLVSIGRLTASIAHEIRNPLGAISHAGQLLAESDAIGPDEQRLLDIVHRHSRRIDSIIASVLGLSRRSGGGRETINLGPWLDNAIEDYCQQHAQAPQFTTCGVGHPIEIQFDPAHLRQILFNLWDNSQRHGRRDLTVLRITLTAHDNRYGLLCLDIADNGPGLEPAIASRIMEPFFTTAHDGTGLGLYIARELCEANGAQLAPVTRPGGACFRIIFAHTPGHLPNPQHAATAHPPGT